MRAIRPVPLLCPYFSHCFRSGSTKLKIMKRLFYLLIPGLLLAGCAKEGPVGPAGPQGDQGVPGPAATVQTYTLNFDGTTSWASYNGFDGIYSSNDVILSYVYWTDYGGDNYYIQLPYTDAGSGISFYTEMNNSTGHLFQNIESSSGGVGFTSSTNVGYKSMLIEGRSFENIPDNLDLKDYTAVSKYFGIE